MTVDDSSVHVAVRIRPQSVKEKNQLNEICTYVPDGVAQIQIGKEKSFTFDHVFNINSAQETVFEQIAKPLIDGCLQGYNATLLAYGQTGSGKTYTMGTSLDYTNSPNEVGIVPRAVTYLFVSIDQLRQQALEKGLPPPEFKVMAQFMELYNEDLHDLLDMGNSKGPARIKIHEDAKGNIYFTGVSSRVVCNLEETMKCLSDGAAYRSTACTDMNTHSSRSHAIFTLFIKQHRVVVEDETIVSDKEIDTIEAVTEFETLSAKFHFVDLAGSERLKRTGATGDRAKEGIAINCGLLALGNVISALGDKQKRGCHVPYRDSKLTRLLQDSLGGNSRTIMIACISPSDCDFLETLNTLQYANRARNIKNKIVVNQDKASQQIAALRAQIADLQRELMEYKTGHRALGEDGAVVLNDLHVENSMLQKDNASLTAKLKAASSSLLSLQTRNAQLLADLEACEYWRRRRSRHVEAEGPTGVETVSDKGDGDTGTIQTADLDSTLIASEEARLQQDEFAVSEFRKVVEKYAIEVEELRTRLQQSEALNEVLERAQHANRNLLMNSPYATATADMSEYRFDFGGESVKPNASGSSTMLTTQRQTSDGAVRKKDTTAGKKGMRRLMSASVTNSPSQISSVMEESNKGSGSGNGGDTSSESQSGSGSMPDLGGSGASGNDLLASDSDTVADESDSLDDEEEEDKNPETTLLQTLAHLDTKIDEREMLLEELRVKARHLEKMRQFYEKELQNLRARIQAAELERDQHLASMEHMTEEKIKKAKMDYEEKINVMKDELKKLNSASSELARKQREHHRLEMERDRLLREVEDFKRQKVELSKKMREEAKRHRDQQLARDREITSLRKAKTQADHRVQMLEQDRQRRESVLKRSQEENAALRRRQANRPPVSKPMAPPAPPAPPSQAQSQPTPRSAGTFRVPLSSSRGIRKDSQSTGTGVGEVSLRHRRRNSTLARLAKNKWDQLESVMSNVVNRRHMQARFDRDLSNWMREREKLKRRIATLQTKTGQVENNESHASELDYKLRHLRAQLESAQEQITECQANIVELSEESQADTTVATVLAQCSLEEAHYLLNHLFEETIQKAVLAEQKMQAEAHLRQLLASKTKEKEQALEMLHIAVSQPNQVKMDMEAMGLTVTEEEEEEDEDDDSDSSDSEDELRLGDTDYLDSAGSSCLLEDCSSSKLTSAESISKKLRGTSATTDDLLGGGSTFTVPPSSTRSGVPVLQLQTSNNAPMKDDPFTPGGLMTMSMDESQLRQRSGLRGSFRYNANNTKQPVRRKPPLTTAPPSNTSTVMTSNPSVIAPPSSTGGRNILSPPSVRRRAGVPPQSAAPIQQSSKTSSLMTQSMFSSESSSSFASLETNTPGSNLLLARTANNLMTTSATEGNVFSRLTVGTHRGSPIPTKGQITACNRNPSTPRAVAKCPFECLFVAEGHAKPVLDISLHSNILLSGSKDRTAKVWDLASMCEVTTLPPHSNNVVKVHYAPTTHLYYTACSFFINIFDERDPQKPIITLLSSGLTELPNSQLFSENSGAPSGGETGTGVVSATRQNICPAGETNITDFCLDPVRHDVLFMATGISVRYWDLHKFHATAKLHANHQAPVMALACDVDADRGPGQLRLVTGSKDHYMKMFCLDMGNTSGIVTPTADLQPPHYDGIEALALSNDILFSGSRDACIKKWDLSGAVPREVGNVSQAHKDWIQSLCWSHDRTHILSACRGGVVKLWNVENFTSVGEVMAHGAPGGVNAVRADENVVVTAGNDSVIRLWKVSPDMT